MGVTTAKGNRKQKLVTRLVDKDGTEVTTLTCTSRQFSLASNPGRNITLGLFKARGLPHFLACHIPSALIPHICRILSFRIVLTFCFCLFVCLFFNDHMKSLS